MALIEWREEFTVGVPSIDREHRELIALVNRAHARLDDPRSDVTISDFLGEIYARIAGHFESEERVMRAARYDQTELHAAEHERLLDEMRAMMRAYEHRHLFEEQEFAGRLRDWFVNHFRTHDARLHGRLGA
jgi:hemerythrin